MQLDCPTSHFGDLYPLQAKFDFTFILIFCFVNVCFIKCLLCGPRSDAAGCGYI